MYKRGYSRHAVSVRPSVCPFITFVDHVKTNKHLRIFFTIGSHTILVFQYQTRWRYSDGNPPPNGGVECRQGRSQNFHSGGVALPISPLALPPVPSPSLPSSLFPSPFPGGGLLPHYQLGGLGKRCKLPQRGPGGAPAANAFLGIFAAQKRIWWQQFCLLVPVCVHHHKLLYYKQIQYSLKKKLLTFRGGLIP